MKYFPYKICIVLSFILISCGKNSPTEPDHSVTYDIKVFCDTCGNDAPLTLIDSVYGNWPSFHPNWVTSFVSYSPDHRYIAGNCSIYSLGPNYRNVLIYDLLENRTVALLSNKSFPDWNPDGKCLAMITGGGSVEIFDMQTLTLNKVSIPINGYGSKWTSDGEYILIGSFYNIDSSKDGIYRIRPDGTGLKYLFKEYTDNFFGVDTSTYISIYNYGFIVYNKEDGTKKYHEIPYFASLPSKIQYADLSPDGEKIVCEVILKGGIDPGTRGLFVIDLKNLSITKILDNFRYRPNFYPRWGSNSTLLVSLFCVNEYSYTTWEIDLNGKLLKKLTHINMEL